MDSYPFKKYNLSIAPMLDITNHHFRSFFRLLTKETLLYTEMIVDSTVLHSKINFNIFEEQKPICLQLGGNDPKTLFQAAEKLKDFGFDEMNLNCGCPSECVQKGNFGISLMNNPLLVSECVKEMNKILPTSIKCRIGVNKFDLNFLNNFIETTSNLGGVKKYIIHSRIALTDFDTKKNRSIPPLDYEVVYGLKEKYPQLHFVLNGGIKTLEEVKEHNEKGMDVMIGRAAYETPWIFRNADNIIFGKNTENKLSRKELIYKYCDYCKKYFESFPKSINRGVFVAMIRPLTNLFHEEVKSKKYKEDLNNLKEIKTENYDDFIDHLYKVNEEYEKINPIGVNSL